MSNQNNDDNDSKHKMFTRSKRQRNLEEKEPLKKQKVIDSSNYLNDSNSDSDLDEYGNVRDLIDYDCEETDEDVDLDNYVGMMYRFLQLQQSGNLVIYFSSFNKRYVKCIKAELLFYD